MDGLNVLIVEDCILMAEALEDLFADAGVQVVAKANSVQSAFAALADHAVGLVCLDIDLGGESSFAVAEHLTLCAIPFVFVTAVERQKLPPAYRQRPFVRKADIPTQLLSTCRKVAHRNFAAMGAA
jgi:DNA-binding NarL/FixJ family response regulator